MLYLPHRRKRHMNSWGNWDERIEAGLVDLVDDDIFVCSLENSSAGGDETGMGVVSGADLVLTDVASSISGAVGSPPTRFFSGPSSNDRLRATAAWGNSLLSNNTWTIAVSFKNLEVGGHADDYIFNCRDSGSNNWIILRNVSGKIDFYIEDGGTAQWASLTSSALTTGSPNRALVMLWADGTNPVRGGFLENYSVLPTKWSDFPSGQRTVVASNTGSFSGVSWINYPEFAIRMGFPDRNFEADVYYVVASRKSLIEV